MHPWWERPAAAHSRKTSGKSAALCVTTILRSVCAKAKRIGSSSCFSSSVPAARTSWPERRSISTSARLDMSTSSRRWRRSPSGTRGRSLERLHERIAAPQFVRGTTTECLLAVDLLGELVAVCERQPDLPRRQRVLGQELTLGAEVAEQRSVSQTSRPVPRSEEH